MACKAQEVFLILAGAAVEFCPRIFQQPLVPELLLGVVMAVAWWFWPPSATNSAVYRAMGLLIAYMWLVPSRDFGSNPAMGRIKWLLVLVAIELVFGTRVPGTELAALVVIAIGLLALAIDSWLAGFIPSSQGNSARTNAGALFLRWTVLPVLLVIAAANLMGIWIVETTASYHVAHQPGRANEFGEELELLSMPENASFGDHRSVERDPRIAARLFWETGSAPTGIVYLRALALPDLVLSESTITWIAAADGERRTSPATSTPNRWAQLDRVASSSEVVLHPDGNDAVELPEISEDDAGNLYSTALLNRPCTYRVGFDDQRLKADLSEAQRCLEVDPRLNDLPWDQIEHPALRFMTAERAAAFICTFLQSECSYETTDLPLPMEGFAGALRGFLFGPTPEARRVHCRYS